MGGGNRAPAAREAAEAEGECTAKGRRPKAIVRWIFVIAAGWRSHMRIPIFFLAVSFLGLLVTVGLPRFRPVPSLPILTWPLIRTLLIHPTRWIAFQYSRRIFFG